MKIFSLMIYFLLFSCLYAQKIKIENPNLVGVYVCSAENSAQWYTEKLGFKTFKKMDFPEYDSLKIYFLEKENFRLELIQKKTALSAKNVIKNYDEEKTPLLGFAKLSFIVKNIKELEDKLKSENVKIRYPLIKDNEFKEMSFIVEDPDGNYIQFVEPF